MEIEMDISVVDRFINECVWTFAKRYADKCPHEYIVKANVDAVKFEMFVMFIRMYGFVANYFKSQQTYFIHGDYYYWTMGAPLHKTIIINRAKLTDYVLEDRSWRFKGGTLY